MKYRTRVYSNGRYYPQIKTFLFWKSVIELGEWGTMDNPYEAVPLFETKEEALNRALEELEEKKQIREANKKDKKIRKEKYDF